MTRFMNGFFGFHPYGSVKNETQTWVHLMVCSKENCRVLNSYLFTHRLITLWDVAVVALESCLHFYHLSTPRAHVVKTILMVAKVSFILGGQYHGRWWLGAARSHVIWAAMVLASIPRDISGSAAAGLIPNDWDKILSTGLSKIWIWVD